MDDNHVVGLRGGGAGVWMLRRRPWKVRLHGWLYGGTTVVVALCAIVVVFGNLLNQVVCIHTHSFLYSSNHLR